VVAFESDARDLHALDMDSGRDIYARNLVTGTTHLVSINAAGTGSGDGTSREHVISADGSVVAFVSNAHNLHPLRTESSDADVFARNIMTGTTYLVSINAAGSDNVRGNYSRPVISAEGSVVVFTSGAANHHALDTNGSNYGDVFARNLVTGTTYVVSVNAAGTGSGNHSSQYPVISADGRVIAFESNATNLVNGDGNTHPDVFTRDVSSGSTQLVSKAHPSLFSATSGSNSSINRGALSADGRYVAFVSRATNLVSGLEVVPGVQNVYRLDRVTGEVLLVSVNALGTGSGNSYSYEPVISADGNVVAFRSTASNLHSVQPSSIHYSDIYARNLTTGTTYLVSINALGNGRGNDHSFKPVISADGNVVAFQSWARNLHNLDSSNDVDVFARNLTTGTTYLVSINTAGTGSGNDDSVNPVISSDGRIIAFESTATNLHPLDPHIYSDVFARNIVSGTTYLVSVSADDTSGSGGSYNPSISAKGDVVAFQSSATNLHPLDTSVEFDIYARNIVTGTTYLASVNSAGTGGGFGQSENPVISADGRVVAFQSSARNLHPLDTDFLLDVFARNLATGTTHWVSNGSGTRSSSGQVINADGSIVAFVSTSNNLHPLDNNHIQDVFARNLTAEATYLISTNSTGNGSGNNASFNPIISASGSYVGFGSTAMDLVLADFNSSDDVFLGQGPALPADYNEDNQVDAADYVVWRKTLNQSVAHFSGADGDGDGVVDQDDHDVWRTNFAGMIGMESIQLGAGSGNAMGAAEPIAQSDAAAAVARVSFEPSPSPSLKGWGTSRLLQLQVVAQRESALAAWLVMRGRSEEAEKVDVIGLLRVMQDGALGESRLHDVLDEAFANCGVGQFLSPFQGFVARDGT
jgi:hypothetical protein